MTIELTDEQLAVRAELLKSLIADCEKSMKAAASHMKAIADEKLWLSESRWDELQKTYRAYQEHMVLFQESLDAVQNKIMEQQAAEGSDPVA